MQQGIYAREGGGERDRQREKGVGGTCTNTHTHAHRHTGRHMDRQSHSDHNCAVPYLLPRQSCSPTARTLG